MTTHVLVANNVEEKDEDALKAVQASEDVLQSDVVDEDDEDTQDPGASQQNGENERDSHLTEHCTRVGLGADCLHLTTAPDGASDHHENDKVVHQRHCDRDVHRTDERRVVVQPTAAGQVATKRRNKSNENDNESTVYSLKSWNEYELIETNA